jgi:hypothetical protein
MQGLHLLVVALFEDIFPERRKSDLPRASIIWYSWYRPMTS